MALILCKECSATISNSTRRCPKCGARIRPSALEFTLDAAIAAGALAACASLALIALVPEVRLSVLLWVATLASRLLGG